MSRAEEVADTAPTAVERAPVSVAAPEPATLPFASGRGQPLTEPQLRRSLRSSVFDGLFWAIMYGSGERYLLPFLIYGKSGLVWLAATAALPNLFGALVQCFAVEVVDRAPRRKPFCVTAASGQALLWLPLCVGVFLSDGPRFWVVLVAYAISAGFINVGGPAWNSLMGDLVPESRRGRFFGFRSTVVGVGQVVFSLAAGWWLTHAEKTGLGYFGLDGRSFAFLLLFAIAAAARGTSAFFMSRMHEPPYHTHPAGRFTLLDFVRRAPRAHFGRFVFFNALMNAGTWCLNPFLFWYVLDHLSYSAWEFAWLGVANWAALYSSTYAWGWLADRVGAKRILTLSGIGLLGVPLLLLASDAFWWIALIQVYDGLISAGYSIGATNYLFDAVTPPKRARCTAYNTLFVALGVTAGVAIGMLVAQNVVAPVQFLGLKLTHAFQAVLIASAVLRLIGVLLVGSFSELRLSRPVFTGAPYEGSV